MGNIDMEKIRNVAVIAHSGAGKTSLIEAMLFNSGAIDRLGNVEDGTTTTDFEPEEIARKIRITSSVAFCNWKNHRINLVDTPGFMNFLEDTRGCMRAVDGVVVIVSALSGVKAKTQKIWKYASDFELPRIVATCSVKCVQGIYQITAQLIGVETGRVEKIASRRCQAKLDFLGALFNEIAFELAGEEGRKGSVLIETDPPEAEVYLFGVALGSSPLTLKLAPGAYLLSVDRDGYLERRKTLYVDEGKETAWKVKLAKQKGSGLGAYIRGMGFWSNE